MQDAIEEHPHMLTLEIALDRLVQGQRHIGEQIIDFRTTEALCNFGRR
jgi:hypothetical protein